MEQLWKLSPSDLTFLWDECPRCFYLKYVHNFSRPRIPFPKIFNRIDKLMKDFFENQPASNISSDLPDGKVLYGEKWVTSAPIFLNGHSSACYIRGKFDTVVEFFDGSYAVVDFKTSETNPKYIPFYSRQLHSYAYALEHPGDNSLNLHPVTRMGLLCVEPVNMDSPQKGQYAYIGNAIWLECPKNEAEFLDFLDSVLLLLEKPNLPNPGPECGYCLYREQSRNLGF